jgi:DNA ligase (NAD+)
MREPSRKELEDKVRKHRRLYYAGKPEISDEAFDAIEDQLRRFYPNSPVLAETGAPGESGWPKFEHSMKMNSLNKVNSVEEMEGWASKHSRVGPAYSWSEKLDGISIALYYYRGELVRAVTRGNGEAGEVITRNVLLMNGVHRTIGHSDEYEEFTGCVRGEIVVRKPHFDKLEGEYSNTRNAAAGIARRQSDPRECKWLTVYAYDVVEFDSGTLEDTSVTTRPANELKKFDQLQKMGFYTPSHGCGSRIDYIGEVYEHYADEKREGLNYDIDGLVVRLTDEVDFQDAGWSSERPKGAVAIKFANETAVTTLTEVKWQVGRSGRITPVAIYEPVELAGAVCERANLHNWNNVEDLGLCIGDEIVVERAGDVIPDVREVLSTAFDTNMVRSPLRCPECSGPTEFDGAYLMCISKDCPAKLPGRISKWLEACGVLGWGDAAVEAICEDGMVESVNGLYALTPDYLASLSYDSGVSIGGSRGRAMIVELQENSTLELAKFIKGLGIPLCGERFARRAIETGFDTLEKLQEASVQDLRTVPKVGPKKAVAFRSGIREREELIRDFLDYVTIEEISGPLDGLSFCATGSLSEGRKKIYKRIEEAGGTTKSGVSKSLDYLICNDKNATSSKAKKARRYETPIITEDELREMM